MGCCTPCSPPQSPTGTCRSIRRRSQGRVAPPQEAGRRSRRRRGRSARRHHRRTIQSADPYQRVARYPIRGSDGASPERLQRRLLSHHGRTWRHSPRRQMRDRYPEVKEGSQSRHSPAHPPGDQRPLATYVAKGPEALLPGRSQLSPVRQDVRRYYVAALKDIGRDGKKKPRPAIHDLRHFAGTQTAHVGKLLETMGRLGHTPSRPVSSTKGLSAGATPRSPTRCRSSPTRRTDAPEI